MAILLLCRLPTFATLLMEVKDFQVIIETARRMMSPFLSVLFSLWLIMFTFNAFGLVIYGGLIRLDRIDEITSAAGNPLYYQLNFNDNVSGMLTLFAVLVSNNWPSTTAMYCTL